MTVPSYRIRAGRPRPDAVTTSASGLDPDISPANAAIQVNRVATALREMALLWLADKVDEGLQRYRAAHHISDTWEARERVVSR
jgi:K+-transporting ATPase c subunit